MHRSSYIGPGGRKSGSRTRATSFQVRNTSAVLWQVIGLLVVLSLSTGCAASSRQVISDTAQSGTVLFSDDFSQKLSGWGVWDHGGGSVEYYEGGLRILVSQAQYDYWSVAGQKFRDVQVEVDATRLAGPEDNDFGIICRYADKDNFYLLVVSSDGYYGIAKVKMGQYSMIGSDQLQYSSAIAQEQALNQLRADCDGPNLRLYANGQKLMEVQDNDFTVGDVGVLAGAFDSPGVDILFDNFVVKKP